MVSLPIVCPDCGARNYHYGRCRCQPAPPTYSELRDRIEQLKQMRESVTAIIQKYEAGQNHDEGAYDADCETCRILSDLRAALTAGKCGRP